MSETFKARLIGGPHDYSIEIIEVEDGAKLPDSITKGIGYIYVRSEALPEPPADVTYVFEGI